MPQKKKKVKKKSKIRAKSAKKKIKIRAKSKKKPLKKKPKAGKIRAKSKKKPLKKKPKAGKIRTKSKKKPIKKKVKSTKKRRKIKYPWLTETPRNKTGSYVVDTVPNSERLHFISDPDDYALFTYLIPQPDYLKNSGGWVEIPTRIGGPDTVIKFEKRKFLQCVVLEAPNREYGTQYFCPFSVAYFKKYGKKYLDQIIKLFPDDSIVTPISGSYGVMNASISNPGGFNRSTDLIDELLKMLRTTYSEVDVWLVGLRFMLRDWKR